MIDYKKIQAIPEIDLLLEVIRTLPKKSVILEIGTYLGGTTVRIAEEKPEAIIFTVDPCDHGNNWNEPYNAYVQEYLVNQVLRSPITKEHLLNNIKRFPNINFIQGYSPQCIKDWNIEIDLYFEDGDHGNPRLNRNLEFVKQFVRPNGYIAAHDYCDECPDVIQEVDKLIDQGWKKVGQDRRLIILQKDKIL